MLILISGLCSCDEFMCAYVHDILCKTDSLRSVCPVKVLGLHLSCLLAVHDCTAFQEMYWKFGFQIKDVISGKSEELL